MLQQIMDCLNCKKVDCDYIGPIQPHETHDFERAPNMYTIDMVVSIAKKAQSREKHTVLWEIPKFQIQNYGGNYYEQIICPLS